MIDDLAVAKDDTAGHGVVGGNEKRTSLELEMASSTEARKGTYGLGCWGS
jgi:hypothetical protein